LQLGAMIATYVIETKGTQEYRFTSEQFVDRFKSTYGEKAAQEVSANLG